MKLLTRRTAFIGTAASVLIPSVAKAASLATVQAASSSLNCINDGLEYAPNGSPQFPTILNSYGGTGSRQKGLISGKQYQPPWNVAGVDYAVGPNSRTSFADGTNPANLPSGVSISNGQVTVATGTSDIITVDSLDFTGLTGGGGGSSIVYQVTGTGTAIVTNCKFLVPPYFSTGNQFFIRCSSASTVVFKYCDVDGNGASVNTSWNTPLFQMTGACNQTIEYNYIHNISYDGIYPSGGLTDTLTSCVVRYNVFAYVNYASAAHFDSIQFFGQGTGLVVQFNTMYQPIVDQNGVTLGPVNSFCRIGDLGSSSGLTFTNAEIGWNTICGAGKYLSVMQVTDHNTPAGFFVNPSIHDNFIDVNNVTNFWCYDVDSHFTNVNYINNICLNNASQLPSFIGNGGSARWNPSFLNGRSSPSRYVAPTAAFPCS